jgi:hypothetical protein
MRIGILAMSRWAVGSMGLTLADSRVQTPPANARRLTQPHSRTDEHFFLIPIYTRCLHELEGMPSYATARKSTAAPAGQGSTSQWDKHMVEVSFLGGEVRFVSWDWHSFRVKSSMACSGVPVSVVLQRKGTRSSSKQIVCFGVIVFR